MWGIEAALPWQPAYEVQPVVDGALRGMAEGAAAAAFRSPMLLDVQRAWQ